MGAAWKVFAGLKILLKLQPDADIDAQHDVLKAGGPEPDRLDDVDRKSMEELGWSYNAQEECWCKFT